MKHRIEYENGVYREKEHCEGCNGRGSIQPVYHGEREAPDARERETCEVCAGEGYTVLELQGVEAQTAAHHEGIWTEQGAACAATQAYRSAKAALRDVRGWLGARLPPTATAKNMAVLALALEADSYRAKARRARDVDMRARAVRP